MQTALEQKVKQIRPSFRFSFIMAMLLYLLTAAFSTGHYHGDEHFQIIEFANFKAGYATASDLAWEYKAQIRPGLQPALAYVFIKGFTVAGITDPFKQVFLLRALSALLMLTLLFFLWHYVQEQMSIAYAKKMAAYAMLLFWFVPFLAVRFSSETWSALFFFSGLILMESVRRTSLTTIIAALLMGLAFQFRYQMAVMIVAYLLWLIIIKKQKWEFLFLFKFGLLISLIIGIACDYWLYNEFVFAPWQYFKSNILLGTAAEVYGKSPWWYYFSAVTESAVLPIGIVLCLGVLLFFILFPKHVFTWISLPFICMHIVTAHKEVRFLFPLFPIAIAMLLLVVDYFLQHSKFVKVIKVTFVILFLVNIIPLIRVVFLPANSSVEVLSIISHKAKANDVVYWIEQNPTSPFGLPYTFFKLPSSVRIEQIASPDLIPANAGGRVFLVSNCKPKNQQYRIHESEYYCMFSSLPVWVGMLNFNQWLDRTTVTRLYIRY